MDFYEKIFSYIRHEKLSDTEYTVMRNELVHFMEEHPVTPTFTVRLAQRLSAILSPLDHLRVAMPAALALVLVIGIGTSYASELALPGDVLYPVKVSLVEPIKGSLARSPQEKAKWNKERIETRLEEAEQLAAKDSLTPAARADIEQRIESTAQEFNTNVATLASASDDSQVVAVQSDLEATLEGHEKALEAITAVKPASTSSVSQLIAAVRSQRNTVATLRAKAEMAVTKQDENIVERVAVTSKRAASTALNTVRSKAAAARSSGSVAIGGDASSSATHIEMEIANGSKKLDEGDYAQAFGSFQAAIRAAKATDVDMDARAKIGEAMTAAGLDVKTDAATSTSTSASSTATTTATSTATTTIDLNIEIK